MPTAFRDLLNGKHHLPDNALRPSRLNPDTGFLGSGEFREHLCGQDSSCR